MKHRVFAIMALVLSLAGYGQGIHGLSVTDAGGQTHSLAGFAGKKIWLVVLPVTQTAEDSAFLRRIDSIATANQSGLQTIGIPPLEDGFVADSAASMDAWYRSLLDTGILISRPVYTHVESGAAQDSLFNWLTHANGNQHFDYEVQGPGTMFFADGEGNLIGLFGPEAKDSDKVVGQILP